MRRVRGSSPDEINSSLNDVDRRLRSLEFDDGHMAIPTGKARAPKKGARLYFDEETGQLVIVTPSGISRWSRD